MVHQGRDVGGPGHVIHGDQRQHHQHRAEQGIEEELEGRIDPARPAPDADDQEHRDQHALEEHVEEHEIQGAEGADHEGLEHQEGDHVFLDPDLDRFPGREDADRGQQRREQDEEHGDAVDTHVVADAEGGDPIRLLDELEIGRAAVEAEPERQRQQEGDERGPECEIAGVAGDGRRLAAQHEDQRAADQGQEGDEGEDRPAAHGVVTELPRRDTS